MNTIGPMPRHLKRFSWYAPHQAWLAEKGLPHHEFPKGTKAVRAYLSRADLSRADLTRLDLREACLSGADLRWADLRWADLRGANLTRLDLREACLSGADLRWADLRGANLTRLDLREACLSGADLRWAELSAANLRGCVGLPAAPIVEGLDRAVYEAVKYGCSLEMDIWHSCETVHCRGGWAIHLAGESGKEFERVYGSSVAAALIYHASTDRVPDFYATNEDAMADIKKCAGVTLDSTCPGKMGGGR